MKFVVEGTMKLSIFNIYFSAFCDWDISLIPCCEEAQLFGVEEYSKKRNIGDKKQSG